MNGHPGFGVGLRSEHFRHVLERQPGVDWFEIISENFLDNRGWPRHVLDRVAERYPIVMHGVSMSIGSTDPLDFDYLTRLRQLAAEIRPLWISDHLCWTGVAGRTTHDLLPLPLNEETLRHVVERIRIVQNFLGRRLVLENPSTYVAFTADTLAECDFLAAMAAEADCALLLDVNNVYVSSVNHGFDPVQYIETIPADRVVQIHVAGHTNHGTHIIDTHEGHVIDRVWELYALAYRRTNGVATLVEWDSKIPPFEVLHAEALKAKEWVTDVIPSVARELGGRGAKHVHGAPPAQVPRSTLGMTLQRWMQEVITHPAGINPEGVDDAIRPSATLAPVQRLAIYHRSYHERLLECFRALFPALRHSLGDEPFDRFALAYLQVHPPSTFTLSRVADRFPQWLEETRPEEDESWTTFLIELAAFEHAYREVYDGGTPQRAFRFRHPVHRYQAAVRRGESPELPPPEETFVLLCLRHDRVVVHELSQAEHAALLV